MPHVKGWLQSQVPGSSQQSFITQVRLILAFAGLTKGTEWKPTLKKSIRAQCHLSRMKRFLSLPPPHIKKKCLKTSLYTKTAVGGNALCLIARESILIG